MSSAPSAQDQLLARHIVFRPGGEIVEHRPRSGAMPLWNGATPNGPIFRFLASAPKRRPFALFTSDVDIVSCSQQNGQAAATVKELRRLHGEDIALLAPSALRGGRMVSISGLVPQYDDMFRGSFRARRLHRTPWRAKLPGVAWRGSAHIHSDGDLESAHFLLRYSAIAALRSDPRADVGFHPGFGGPQTSRPYLSPSRMCRYKAVLAIDGWGWPGNLGWALASRCVVLLVSRHETWISDRLRPWEHYVPVELDDGKPPDLADLPRKLDWVCRHDREARAIAERAWAFYQDEMNPAAQRRYLRQLLNEEIR